MSEFKSYTFGRCVAYERGDRTSYKWGVLCDNADIGLWIGTETEACLLAALIAPLTDAEWRAVKGQVVSAMNEKVAA